MKILIDECLPFWLAKQLSGHDVKTVQQKGWSAVKDPELLTLAEAEFEVFLTADKNLRHQQNLSSRRIAVVVLPSNRLSVVQGLVQRLMLALQTIQPGVMGQTIELFNP